MTQHECEDHLARRTVEHLQGEVSELEGRIMREIGDVHAEILHVGRFLKCPPRVRRGANGSALTELVEEVTGSHNVPSVHPVRASIERFLGRKVLQVVKLAALGVLGWTGHWLWTVLWAAVRK